MPNHNNKFSKISAGKKIINICAILDHCLKGDYLRKISANFVKDLIMVNGNFLNNLENL